MSVFRSFRYELVWPFNNKCGVTKIYLISSLRLRNIASKTRISHDYFINILVYQCAIRKKLFLQNGRWIGSDVTRKHVMTNDFIVLIHICNENTYLGWLVTVITRIYFLIFEPISSGVAVIILYVRNWFEREKSTRA